MKNTILICAAFIAFTTIAACTNECPTEGQIVIYPKCELKTDIITIDSIYNPFCLNVSLHGHTKDSLYLSFAFCNSKFWNVDLVGDIDTTYENDWYNDTLAVTYHTRTTNDGDNVVVRYSFGTLTY